jgi:hypothetical protein
MRERSQPPPSLPESLTPRRQNCGGWRDALAIDTNPGGRLCPGSSTKETQMRFVPRRLFTVAAIVTLTIMGGALTQAKAANWSLFTCAYPNGTPVNATSGWSAHAVGSPGPYSGTGNSCGGIGGSLGAESSNEWPQNGYSGWQWVFNAPGGSLIVGGSMQVGFNTPKGQAYVEDPENIYGPDVLANCQYNVSCTSTQYPVLPNNNATNLYVGAECAIDPTCEPAGTGVDASVAIYRATIIMQNASVPTGSAFEGGLSTPATVSGDQDLKFTAADPGGPGVYSVTAAVDGTQVYGQTPPGDSATCVNQGQVTEGLSFLSVVPCSSSLSVSIPLDTTTLKDGSHSLKVSVTDAASNTSVVFDKTITTENAPTVSSEPTISGTAQVGSTLTGTNAVFAARSGTGSLSQNTDQWLRCGESGTGCSAIAGATSGTYTPVAADSGYTMEFENFVEDGEKHKASATSPPTLKVSESSGAGSSCLSSGCQTGGGGNGGNGGSGGAGSGGTAGSGGSGAGSGAAVTVDVVGGGSNLGSVPLGSASRWSVSLHVSPGRVRRHSKLKLTGLVSTSPRPGEGKLIYLQARSVGKVFRGSGRRRHRVTVYGKWTSFQIFRAKTNGTFSSTYRFRLGGRHTYQFRAVAPAEGQYRNPTGSSVTSTVKEI